MSPSAQVPRRAAHSGRAGACRGRLLPSQPAELAGGLMQKGLEGRHPAGRIGKGQGRARRAGGALANGGRSGPVRGAAARPLGQGAPLARSADPSRKTPLRHSVPPVGVPARDPALPSVRRNDATPSSLDCWMDRLLRRAARSVGDREKSPWPPCCWMRLGAASAGAATGATARGSPGPCRTGGPGPGGALSGDWRFNDLHPGGDPGALPDVCRRPGPGQGRPGGVRRSGSEAGSAGRMPRPVAPSQRPPPHGGRGRAARRWPIQLEDGFAAALRSSAGRAGAWRARDRAGGGQLRPDQATRRQQRGGGGGRPAARSPTGRADGRRSRGCCCSPSGRCARPCRPGSPSPPPTSMP